MKRKRYAILLLLAVISLLAGCSMRTIKEMYSPPKRPEGYTNLQTQINQVMVGAEYCAPISGENRQAVQSADLDGDEIPEYLLFTKTSKDNPLQIHIFTGDGKEYYLLGTISSPGNSFELIEYQQLDGRDGVEIIVGKKVSNQIPRNVSVYTLQDGQIRQLMTTNYSKFVCTDLDRDSKSEILVLRPGETNADNGIAELYSVIDGVMERSAQVDMSEPSESIKRIMVGKLQDGQNAVYVASDVDGNAIVTDIYTLMENSLTNVTFSNESGTGVNTLRNYYVYADDIDVDGVLELPDLTPMKLPDETPDGQWKYLIRWYSMYSDGTEHEKVYTYHNFTAGWYMQLRTSLANRIFVVERGNGYLFGVWDETYSTNSHIATIYALTGQNREQEATVGNRFVLHRTESTVFAADLDVSAAVYNISKEEIINSFHLILQDWNTGET